MKICEKIEKLSARLVMIQISKNEAVIKAITEKAGITMAIVITTIKGTTTNTKGVKHSTIMTQ
jgi:hypothetical protein